MADSFSGRFETTQRKPATRCERGEPHVKYPLTNLRICLRPIGHNTDWLRENNLFTRLKIRFHRYPVVWASRLQQDATS
jgi:hypothetical protein